VTASNIFTQGDVAYLITDGAWFNMTTGVVTGFGTKVVTSSPLRIAICFSGIAIVSDFQRMLDAMHSQDEALEHIPDMARMADGWHRDAVVDAGNTWPDVGLQMFVATYSEKHRAPRLFVYSTNGAGGKYSRGVVRQIEHLISPSDRTTGMMDSRVDKRDPTIFDVNRDGLKLLEQQRAYAWENEGNYGVGGFGELTRIDARGVSKRIMCRWPDRIGEPVRP
jgi:hypothetical protein